jgi:hypothetical protein
MAKKHYDLVFDEENMEALDRWLKAAGMSRSGYLNTLITKTVESMNLKKIPDYSKLSIVQLFEMIGDVGKMFEGKKYGLGKK